MSTPASWNDSSPHREGFVTANGIRLQYLDWGGTGPALILIHGIGCNPHSFDDLAPTLTDRFRVIAYARRGHGRSDAKAPYDNDTLTEDLRGLMDGLGIAKAHLVGWSMGGNEITALAGKYPHRVGRLIYLDGAFDWADPEWQVAVNAMPDNVRELPPASALASFDAFRAYEQAGTFSELEDMQRIEADLREQMVVQPDGTLKPRIAPDVMEALMHTLYNGRRDYTRVRSPVLALNSESMLNLNIADAQRREKVLAWEKQYRHPFEARSMARIRREMPDVKIVSIPGNHGAFFVTARAQVVAAMRQFLGEGTL